MKLRRLTGLEREKIENELADLLKTIEELKAILASDEKILEVIKNELLEIKQKYGIPCFSKEQDFYIYYYQNAIRKGKKPSKTILEKINGTYEKGFNGISKKAREYVLSGNAHKITHLCCYYLNLICLKLY